MSLKEYRQKRDFTVTAEPSENETKRPKIKKSYRFVIQHHAATHLHYDFRLELGGVLVSWAVPKGLPLIHGEKRLAMKVEDHPVSYVDFEGTIPKGQYGGGTVQVWDVGTFEPLSKSPIKELDGGKLHFVLSGEKLSGEWYLVQLKGKENQWLIVRAGEDHPKLSKKQENCSVISGRTLDEIAQSAQSSTGSKKSKLAKFLSLEDLKFIEPMKARLTLKPPEGSWEYEVKLDGFRALAYKRKDGVALVSRTKHLMTEKFPEIAAAISNLPCKKLILDGEIVAMDDAGRSSFQLLQAYELGQEKPPLYFYVFDILEHEGKSLLTLPLAKRRKCLEETISGTEDIIRFCPTLGTDAPGLLELARKHRLEGIIGKREGSEYEPGKRSGAWIKLKILNEQEFVIGGYTQPEGARHHFGALLVGVQEKGKLVYAGKVGTGFTSASLSALFKLLGKQSTTKCPFSDLPEERAGRYGQGITAAVMKSCQWVKPNLVAQIKFSEWTSAGRLRQPVFLGLRDDKDPAKVVRETPD